MKPPHCRTNLISYSSPSFKSSSRVTLQLRLESIDHSGINGKRPLVPQLFLALTLDMPLLGLKEIEKNVFILHNFPKDLLVAAGQRGEELKGHRCPRQPQLGTGA